MLLMKKAIIFLAVALGSISSTTQAAPSASVIKPKECPSNQEWTDCGTACPNICGQQTPMFCITFECVKRCQCPSGWWQAGEDCVENEIDCPLIIEPPSPAECPYNQEYNKCGTACPNTCGEPVAKVCTLNCVPECQCPSGWWMQYNGICVEEESHCAFPAPDPCASKPCLNGASCERPQDMPEPGEFYCDCPVGFEGKFCERPGECPANQLFNKCGTACPKICGEPQQPFCIKRCKIGCQCPWGWWQKADGSCVEQEKECYVMEDARE